jgi:hypothetical protein
MRGLIWFSSFREDFNMKNLQCTSDNRHQVMAKVHLVPEENIKIQKVNDGRTDEGRPVVANAHMTLRVR